MRRRSTARCNPLTSAPISAIGRNGLKPVIDRRFAFAEAPAAYRHLASGAHLGKIVIGHDEAAV